jgi:hypothetical protein
VVFFQVVQCDIQAHPHTLTDWDVQAVSLIQLVLYDVQSHPYTVADWDKLIPRSLSVMYKLIVILTDTDYKQCP